jgi:type IV pilus assembly protein PilQ
MLNKKNILLAVVILLSGCHAAPVVKKEVAPSAINEREAVVKLQNANPPTTDDLTKNDGPVGEVRAFKSENILKLRGSDRGLKFTDSNWKDFPVTINLNVVPVRVFFESLQRLTNVNFIVGDDVKGDVTINLRDVNWVEIYQIVLKNKNLIGEVNDNGNIVNIHTPDFISEQGASSEKALKARIATMKAYASLEAKETSIIKLNFAKPDVVQQQLKDMTSNIDAITVGQNTSSVASSRASFILDARTNSIIVHARPGDMEWIKSAIANLDKPTRQVLIDVFIIEATDNFEAQLGSRIGLYKRNTIGGTNAAVSGGMTGTTAMQPGDITLNNTTGSISNNPIASPVGGIALMMSTLSTDLRVELQAMQLESLIKIVSNPKLFIVDNELASITDGTEIPYTVVGTIGGSPTVSFKDAALKLQVRPTITGEGNIYIDLTVNKDTPLMTSSPPPISKKELKTKLLVKDGGVALIGGINKSEATATESGVPFFSKIPVLGNLFKSKDDINRKNQLYIFLAPRVI